jgi:CDGSH-type Zn-finger protein
VPTVNHPADGSAGRDARRITVVAGGPILVEGPVEIHTPDGAVVGSDRFVVAICACRRSKRFPFCDTSHRTRVRHQQDSGTQGTDQC